jgi:hypothetical protein
MSKIQLTIRKRVEGQVQCNQGDFAEIVTHGISGIDTGLIVETIQISRYDTSDGTKEFRRKFRVGTLLDIMTTVDFRSTSRSARDWKELSDAADEVQRRFELGEI